MKTKLLSFNETYWSIYLNKCHMNTSIPIFSLKILMMIWNHQNSHKWWNKKKTLHSWMSKHLESKTEKKSEMTDEILELMEQIRKLKDNTVAYNYSEWNINRKIREAFQVGRLGVFRSIDCFCGIILRPWVAKEFFPPCRWLLSIG